MPILKHDGRIGRTRGRVALVDDGKCRGGQVTEVIGGNNVTHHHHGGTTRRIYRCVARPA